MMNLKERLLVGKKRSRFSAQFADAMGALQYPRNYLRIPNELLRFGDLLLRNLVGYRWFGKLWSPDLRNTIVEFTWISGRSIGL